MRLSASIVVAILAALAVKYPALLLWRKPGRGSPQLSGLPLFGNLLTILKNRAKFHEFLLNVMKDLNTMTFSLPVLGFPLRVVTVDPQNIEHVLKENFTNYAKNHYFVKASADFLGRGIFAVDGEAWKYQRKTASHIFNVKNFRDHFTETFHRQIHIMSADVLDKAAEDKKTINFNDLMYRLTLDTFTLIGFGVPLNSLVNETKIPFAASFDICQDICARRLTSPFWQLEETFQSWFSGGKTPMQENIAIVNAFVEKVIDSRQSECVNNDDRHGDLLSRFMQAKNENGELLNKQEMRDIVLSFIIAGRDTTAQALSWTFYNLMQHPAVETRLREEIMETIQLENENDPKALYGLIKTMTYANAVWCEVLRLHPSVPYNGRRALTDDVLPDGTRVQKGDSVMWTSWAQGRTEAIWGPDAAEFKPERWITPEGNLSREAASKWTAFHAGPRICLGQTLSTLEALLVIVFLVKRYTFKLVANQEITYKVSLTLPLKNGMHVHVEKREL